VDKKKISVKINGTETIFRESGQVKRKEEEEMEWVSPTERISHSKKIVSLAEHRKRKKPFLFRKRSFARIESSWKKRKGVKGKVVVIIISAMIVGTIFGYVLLGIMNKTVPVTKMQPTTSTTSSTKQPTSKAVSEITLPALSLSVLQAGVFKTEDAAASFQQTWKEKGWPAVVVKKDNYYVLAGIGKDNTSLNSLHDVYKAENTNVFKKNYSVEESKLEVAEKEQADKLTKARELYEQLILVTSGQAISAEEKQKLEERYTSIQGEAIKEIQPFIKKLVNAYDLVKVYEKNKTKEELLKVQQVLLDAMVAYSTLIHMDSQSQG
jgi:membrane-associated HD superfamily phosphohydrolase